MVCSILPPWITAHLSQDLSSLSLGALRSAQRKIIQAEALEDSDDDSDGGDSESPEAVSTKEKQPEKPEWDAHPKKPIAHRAHKHAPQEVTSKRPVGRARTVVESHSVQPRDPRFVALTGEFSPEKFTQNYAFLTDSHKTELSTLRENLKRARKLVINSPKHLRAEREGEVSRLEFAVKRAESEVNKDRRLKVERDALSKLKKEEKDKREQGKGSWYMKDAEKKKFMIKARYDALADSGGQRAVKKAIEKKQKKIAQKEKKSRPFSASQQSQDKGWGGRDSKRRRLA
ncbi:DUF947-domain-containing protein [Cylindrobasidium torrendii FP15055 ss-10]|uniref:rRNA biogenesis protein RRP36 n=1 Tax=Cylindrobasidium torrendii FP15055 ss-10 TaxID=1314674 RepID=A0A0D7B226_9AGAR|nr:DUF947-domain-containing protein [Cylindrobasidium torrendii FP15055 ss-10]